MPHHSDHMCLAIFDRAATVRAAIRQLMALGINPDCLEVISSQPHHDQPFLPEKKKTHLGKFAVAGALLGGMAGFLLATLTALAYPIVKGGMPIVAPWPVGIVTYETTMLGAMLSTLLGLLLELKLPNLKHLPYDKSIADGGVLLVVRCPEEGNRTAVQQAVSDAGARKVHWLEGHAARHHRATHHRKP